MRGKLRGISGALGKGCLSGSPRDASHLRTWTAGAVPALSLGVPLGGGEVSTAEAAPYDEIPRQRGINVQVDVIQRLSVLSGTCAGYVCVLCAGARADRSYVTCSGRTSSRSAKTHPVSLRTLRRSNSATTPPGVAVPHHDAVFADKVAGNAPTTSREMRPLGTFLPRRPREPTDWFDSLPPGQHPDAASLTVLSEN